MAGADVDAIVGGCVVIGATVAFADGAAVMPVVACTDGEDVV